MNVKLFDSRFKTCTKKLNHLKESVLKFGEIMDMSLSVLYVKLIKKEFDLQCLYNTWVNWLSHFGLIEELMCQSH